MSDPGQPPRRRWQFHLGTIVATTLCAGAMLGLNLHERELIEPYGGAAPYIVDEKGVARLTGCGWPCVCTLRLEFDDSRSKEFQTYFKPATASATADGSQRWPDGSAELVKFKNGRYVEEYRCDSIGQIAINLLTGTAICAALAALLEFMLRRRAIPAAE